MVGWVVGGWMGGWMVGGGWVVVCGSYLSVDVQ